MSLKAFHLVFISFSCLLAFGFGAWLLHGYHSEGASSTWLAGGLASCLTGVALIVYGRYFLKKLKHISYL